MKYFDFINKVVGMDSLRKGRNIPSYFVEYKDSYKEVNQFVNLFEVLSSYTDDYYDVEIMNNGEEYYNATCTCPQYHNYHTCKHIAACIINYDYLIERNKITDIYAESKELLNLFYDTSDKLTIKEKLNLKIDLNFYYNDITFKLLIGTNRLYVLNSDSKLRSFLDAYYDGGEYKFGQKLTYSKDKYYFDDQDTSIIEYFASIERNSYHTTSLTETDLAYIFDKININKLTINSKEIKEICHGMPSNFILDKNQDKYELTLKDVNDYEILTSSAKYVLFHNYLYILDDKNRKLLKELVSRDIDKILFKKNDLDKFSKGLLKTIKNNIEINENITEINLNLKPTAKLYLDIASNLTCKIKLVYGSNEIDFFEANNEIIRDYEFESSVITDLINNGFNIHQEKILIDDIESIGLFLEEGLTSLSSKYEIYTSKKLDSTNIIKKSIITKDFSIGTSGIMSFNFNVDNINEEELKGIFASLESKKTYHKLKNGDIINLQSDDELQELNNIFNDLELNKNNITSNIEIPKYKALYIDSLKNNKYKDIKTNSIFEDFITNFKEYKNSKITLSKQDEEILRDYQKVGIKWLYALYNCDLGGILADEMGLGKSIQTIYFIKQILKNKKDAKILIVCPVSLVYNWKKEFDKFGSELKYCVISDTKSKRIAMINNNDYNIYITSYGLIRNDIEAYQEINYEVCIVDEAQFIKNYQAKMTISLKQIKARTKLALTGTPIENSVVELWSIFDFLMPGYLNSIKKFHEKYHIKDVTSEDLEKLKSLNYQIEPFILRRKKKDVSKDLPDKVENNIYLELPDDQKKLYLSVLKETEKEINELVAQEGFKKARFKILTLLMRLRQICINPNVIYENYQGEVIKFEKILEMIKDYIKEKHKILIFSSFKRILDLLKIELDNEHISYYTIDGSVDKKSRLPLVDKFNEDDTSCFLITLKSGGTGLNLTSADIVIHLDIWWNPQVENQATDRAHRIGQTKSVIVNRLITKGTIEERILELQDKKKILSDNLIEGSSNNSIEALTEEDMRKLLMFSNE